MKTLENILNLAIDNLKDKIFYNSIKGYYTYLLYYPQYDKTKNYKHNCLMLHFDLIKDNDIKYLSQQINYIINNYVNEKFYTITLKENKNTIELKFYYKN